MRRLIAILVVWLVLPFNARADDRTMKTLVQPPPGAFLPVVLDQALKPHKLRAGQPVTSELVQMVPVTAEVSLPERTKLVGRVVSVSDTSISILFASSAGRSRLCLCM